MAEPLMDLLSTLPDAAPDPVRAERFRGRCHARLERLAARRSRKHHPTPTRSAESVWRPILALVSLAYVAEVIVIALNLFGAH